MTEGEDQFLGNGYDSDLMTDFIIRSPQPQNSSSLPEPREKPPAPENISYQFTNGGLMLYFSLSQPATIFGSLSLKVFILILKKIYPIILDLLLLPFCRLLSRLLKLIG